MRSNQMASHRKTGPATRCRRRTPAVLAGVMMIPALLGAQSATAPGPSSGPIVTVLQSAQYSAFAGHTFALRVKDDGRSDAETEITLEFRDGENTRRAFKAGVLRGGRSVELLFRVPGTGRALLTGVVMLAPIANSGNSKPFAIIEDLDTGAFTVESKPPCPLSQQPEVPSGAEGDCGGGWRVSRLTVEQANSLD